MTSGADEPEAGGAEERLNRLVHDLRTPVTLVQGFADLLVRRGESLSAEERADFARRIAAGARELQSLLDAAR